MPDIASVFWVNLPVSSINTRNTRITRVTHESDTHRRIRPCDILLYHKYSRYTKYSRYSRLQSRDLRKNGHCRERKKPGGAPFLLRLHPGTRLTPAAWRTGIRRAQNAAGDSFCSSEGDQAMHAGTKKRTGWNPRRGSSPFVRKNAKQIDIFQKTARKTGEISRNLPFLVLFGLNCALWQGQKGSNPRPTVLETAALPAELYPCIKEAPAARTDRSEQNTIYYTQADTGCQEGSAVFFRQKIRQKSCKFRLFVI